MAIGVDGGILPSDFVTARARLPQPERLPNLPAQLAAFCELSAVLAEDPRKAIRRFLEIAIRLCHAGSAGLSVVRSSGTGEAIVRWEAVSGALALHEGTDTPRDSSPCGLCLDAGATILIGQPERVFDFLRNTPPSILEDLIVPLRDHANNLLGTLWVTHHDATSRFSSDDAHVLEQLAIQLALALRLLEQSKENGHGLPLVESYQLAHRRLLAFDLAEERRLREKAEGSESEIRRALIFKETALLEVNHRAKNTLQIAASLLALHGRATTSAPVRLALGETAARLHLLAKVHEMLYADADATQEILMPTLLQAMGDALRQSFPVVSERVQLQIASDPIALSPDDAIPVALLANEVVTNAYKHAFPEGTSGMIAINLSCAAENAIILRIMDNGVGMRSEGRGGGLGLKLIRSFAAQLRATLTFDKPADVGGTVVTLRIHRATPLPARA
ncbi:MAG TPA: histidine kinase dimerization/phosphoacceptor domain -containing protein [Povalibacter sp.]